jgi:carboxyl-terminal processing protease
MLLLSSCAAAGAAASGAARARTRRRDSLLSEQAVEARRRRRQRRRAALAATKGGASGSADGDGAGAAGGGAGRGEDTPSPPAAHAAARMMPLARAAANVAVAAGCACLAVAGPWLAAPPPSSAWALPPSTVAVVAAAAAADSSPAAAAAHRGADEPPPSGRDALLALSSELEDDLLRASRELDARAGEALGEALARLRGGGSGGGGNNGPASSSSSSSRLTPADLQADADGRELLREVWEVVDAAYLDARGSGFDRQVWREARDKALAAPVGRYADPSGGAARRAAAGMLARVVRDPYTRLIPPEEFAAMARYDVTGVGLNLGTAEEYVRKTGRALPARAMAGGGGGGGAVAASSSPAAANAAGDGGAAGSAAVQSAAATTATPPLPLPPSEARGVWIVGLSRGSAADVAGARQGDEVVAVGGARLDDPAVARALAGGGGPGSAALSPIPQVTPFQASALISGDLLPDGRSADDAAAAAGGSGVGGVGGGVGGAADPPPVVRLVLRDDAGRERTLELPRRPRQAVASPVTYRLETRRAGGGGLLPPFGGGGGGTKKVGVIAVSSFNARAQRDVAAAASALRSQGAEALELDLRGNRGGLVSEGLEVARLFVGRGAPLVVTRGAAMSAAPPLANPGPAPFGDDDGEGVGEEEGVGEKTGVVSSSSSSSSASSASPPPSASSSPSHLPLTVLVDSRTASASEIVAGALRDNCRAVLAGKDPRTYGKGLIQSVYELSAPNGGGIALTVGKYVTPKGVDIDREGLAPDFRSWPVAEAEAARVLAACRAEGGKAGGSAGGR